MFESCVLFNNFYHSFFFNSVLDYFSSFETGQSGEAKTGEPEKKHNAHPQSELGLSHMLSAGLEPTLVTAVRRSGNKETGCS